MTVGALLAVLALPYLASAGDHCGCMNWQDAYKQVQCGSGREFASIRAEIQDISMEDAQKHDEDFCQGVAFFHRQDHSRCVKDIHFGPAMESKDWCYVDTSNPNIDCEFNGGSHTLSSIPLNFEGDDAPTDNLLVGWKYCVGGEDEMLADLAPADVFKMAKKQNMDPAFMAIMSYPSASPVPEGDDHHVPADTLWEGVKDCLIEDEVITDDKWQLLDESTREDKELNEKRHIPIVDLSPDDKAVRHQLMDLITQRNTEKISEAATRFDTLRHPTQPTVFWETRPYYLSQYVVTARDPNQEPELWHVTKQWLKDEAGNMKTTWSAESGSLKTGYVYEEWTCEGYKGQPFC